MESLVCVADSLCLSCVTNTNNSLPRMQERYEEAGSIANDAISNIRTVASLCAQSKMVEIYERKCLALKAHGIRQGITRAMGYGLSTMLVNCFHGACFFFGAQLVYHGRATIDQVFTVSK